MKQSTKIKLIKFLDEVVGSWCMRCLSAKASLRKATSSNGFLFIRPGGIGDAVLLIPVIQEFKKLYPAASVHVLAEKRNAAIFSFCSSVSNVYRYDALKELFIALQGDYDAVIDTEQWHRLSALIARLTGTSVSVGYATNERKKAFTFAIPYSHQDYEVYSFLNLLAPVSGPLSVDLQKPFIVVPAEVKNRIANRVQEISNKKIVAIFPGGSIREKQWPIERFREVARFVVERGYNIAVVGGREDAALGEIISEGINQRMNLCGRLSLLESAAVIDQAELLITGDSGIMHIASGLGTKMVALFGPGNIKKWASKNDNTVVVSKNLSCSPCSQFGYTPRCKNDVACMKQITVEEVYAKAIELLER